jgi:hypothetical protein
MLDGYSVIVDLDAARARKRLFDPVGHYNRPDVVRLVVDDRPKPHLVSLARSEPVPATPDPPSEGGLSPGDPDSYAGLSQPMAAPQG